MDLVLRQGNTHPDISNLAKYSRRGFSPYISKKLELGLLLCKDMCTVCVPVYNVIF